MMKMLCALVLLLAATNAIAVNKCTGSDGKVSFQDAPCSNEAKTKETVRVREQGTISSAGVYGVSHLDMTGSPAQRLMRALAALENLADLSSDCKIKLQVYGMKDQALDACQRFITHHKAWWDPAVNGLIELENDKTWAAENKRELGRASQHMSKVSSNAEFILLRMQASR
jgi:hypothetical protein